jgi:molybdopterin adenylyltransferase
MRRGSEPAVSARGRHNRAVGGDGGVGDDIRAVVVTVSDGVTQGTRQDASGEAAAALLREAGFGDVERRVVPDERAEIESLLRELAANGPALVVTTGGTGFGPRDVTPEATRAVLDREAPGLAELMRAAGMRHTPQAALSRGVAGTVRETLVLNLPGSTKAVRESLEAVLPVLPHALELIAGKTGEHATGHAGGNQGSPSVAAGGRLREPYSGSLRLPPAARETGGGRPWTVRATAVAVRGNPPCRVGQKLAVGPGGPLEGTLGCAEFDSAAVADSPSVAAGGEPVTRTYVHDLGEIDVFLEPEVSGPTAVVVTASPVGLELLRAMRLLGWRTVLVEPRSERVLEEHRQAADEVRSGLDDASIDGDTSVVHTDHDAPGVVDSIAAALRTDAGFVGVMGSRRHVGPHVEALGELGFDEEDLARVRSPVGIDIGARTPVEIALSIAAGLVAARAGRDGGWLDRRDG